MAGRPPRLPQRPELDWRDDGTPRARGVDDVYYTAGDGLGESRAVFLRGCGLPDAWAGRSAFTVAELGFGTGLNFLALWDLWRQARPAPRAFLTVVSFEGFPLDAGDAARALSAWPELMPLARRLLAAWPDRARCSHVRTFADDGVRLVLHVDDIADALPQTRFEADAWFLDGFSPARNPDMWRAGLWPLVAERTAPGGRLATFTVAGAVRRGLADAGFEVAKVPGHGRKRERLEARLAAPTGRCAPADIHALASTGPPPERIAIIGAGIAGAAMAQAFTARGVAATVFDAGPGPAHRASGNPLALVMPRLDAADTVPARVLIEAYLLARTAYDGRPGASASEVVQRPRGAAEAERFARVLADPPLGLQDLEAIAGGGLLHKRALVLEPARLIPALLDGAGTRYGKAATVDMAARTVDGEAFDAIVLASGLAVHEHAPWLGLEGRLGQVDWVEGAPGAPPSALAAGHYALALGDRRLWGATFEHHAGPAEVREAARAANAEALRVLDPWWRRAALAGEVRSRAGVRATTPDRLPVAGAMPDAAAVPGALAGLRTGRMPDRDAPRVPGVYLAAGLGSRGFTFAPWIAALLVSQAMGDAPPSREPLRAAISPMRLLLRGLKRGRL